MVAIVKITKKGYLSEIKEVSDKYRNITYNWKED
jgi:hypothetical protein